MVHRRRVLAFSAVAVAVVALPVLRSPGRDSFPLSTYPMFAAARPPVASFFTAVALDRSGRQLPLATRAIGGTDEPVHAAVTVQRAIAEGRAAELCAEIARRVAAAGPAGAARVEVVRLEVALLGRAADAAAAPRTVAAACPVPPVGGR